MAFSQRLCALILASSFTLLGSSAALACTCRLFDSFALAKADLATIPSDGLIWLAPTSFDPGENLQGVPIGEPYLRDASTLVTVPASLLRSPGFAILRPVGPLVSGNDYLLMLPLLDSDFEDIVLHRIHVQDEPAPRPAVPVVESVRARTGIDTLPFLGALYASADSCASPYGTVAAAVSVESAGVLQVLTDETDPPIPDAPWEHNYLAATYDSTLHLGNGRACSGGTDALPLQRQGVRVGTFSLTGEFSGWSDPIIVQYPPPGCSCSAQAPRRPDMPFWGFVALIALVRMVRRPIENSR